VTLHRIILIWGSRTKDGSDTLNKEKMNHEKLPLNILINDVMNVRKLWVLMGYSEFYSIKNDMKKKNSSKLSNIFNEFYFNIDLDTTHNYKIILLLLKKYEIMENQICLPHRLGVWKNIDKDTVILQYSLVSIDQELKLLEEQYDQFMISYDCNDKTSNKCGTTGSIPITGNNNIRNPDIRNLDIHKKNSNNISKNIIDNNGIENWLIRSHNFIKKNSIQSLISFYINRKNDPKNSLFLMVLRVSILERNFSIWGEIYELILNIFYADMIVDKKNEKDLNDNHRIRWIQKLFDILDSCMYDINDGGMQKFNENEISSIISIQYKILKILLKSFTLKKTETILKITIFIKNFYLKILLPIDENNKQINLEGTDNLKLVIFGVGVFMCIKGLIESYPIDSNNSEMIKNSILSLIPVVRNVLIRDRLLFTLHELSSSNDSCWWHYVLRDIISSVFKWQEDNFIFMNI
jgi:hypothetical protein